MMQELYVHKNGNDIADWLNFLMIDIYVVSPTC